jgi:hypothetical protein
MADAQGATRFAHGQSRRHSMIGAHHLAILAVDLQRFLSRHKKEIPQSRVIPTYLCLTARPGAWFIEIL